ncbi:MAG: hypothetical protein CL862_13435 [Cyanobium sp. NAT70]|nr:hypothetical protein [Cyanobium sp. NAT70]
MASDVLARAGAAYVHELSFMVCIAALTAERIWIQANPNKQTATKLIITDIIYGLFALLLLLSGIARVLHYGQGTDFYTQNPLFWWKVGLYLTAGALSLYPTITYISWAIPLRKDELPKVSDVVANRIGWVINIELVAFASLPFMASLMARGVGLPS